MNNIRSRINQIGIKTLYKQGRMENALKEHQAILSFIRNPLNKRLSCGAKSL